MTEASIQRFPLNSTGRDFVVGDIHGAFDLVERGMLAVGFDASRDRLFCVGDLVDRGPASERALEFLARPYVHAVRGNHEDNLLQIHENGEPPIMALQWYAQRFGAQWWLDRSREERQALLQAFAKLPFVIEVQTRRGRVGIVHADVPEGMDWATFCERIACGDEGVRAVATEGRDRIHSNRDEGVRGIGRVFVGHTPRWGRARCYGNVYAVDTGAVFAEIYNDHDGHLTVADLAFSTQEILGAPIPAGQVHTLTRTPEDASKPFGLYVREDA